MGREEPARRRLRLDHKGSGPGIAALAVADVQLLWVVMVGPWPERRGDKGLRRRCLPAPPPRSLFTFPVLLAEPPVYALHHPGQLLLFQLPLLLPGRRNVQGPGLVSASNSSATSPKLHIAAAAAAADSPWAPRRHPPDEGGVEGGSSARRRRSPSDGQKVGLPKRIC